MIGPLSTFFTLTMLCTSPLTTLTGPETNSSTAVPLTGGRMRAFINSGDTGAGAVATAGVASFLGVAVEAAALWVCAKAPVESDRQQSRAADMNARRFIVFLL